MAQLADIWNEDFWGFTSLTDSVNILPYQRRMLEEQNIFTKKGISTLTVSAEYKNGEIYLVQTSPRGTPGTPNAQEKAVGRVFSICHLQMSDQVLADDVQGVRDFGSATNLKTVQGVANDKLQRMKRNIIATIEWHRIGAIKGLILDADATTVLFDLNTEFGIARPTQQFDFSSDADDVRVQCNRLVRTTQNAIGGWDMSMVGVLCSDTFFDTLIQHASVKATYTGWVAAQELRQNLAYQYFDFAGCRFINYRGMVSGKTYVDADEACSFPIGTGGLFGEYYGPADYEETVNTMGLEFYAKSEPMKFNRGRELEVQSNPLVLNHRPSSCLKLTMITT